MNIQPSLIQHYHRFLSVHLMGILLLITFLIAPVYSQGVQDLPFSEEQLEQYSGTYSVTSDETGEAVMRMHFYASEDKLFGQINENEPTRMMQQQMHLIRPQAATDWLITLTIEDDKATSLKISSPQGFMTGTRVPDSENNSSQSIEKDLRIDNGSGSGDLFDELARLDSTLFDAAFVTCDTEIRNSLFTEDVEFYHDIEGLSVGEEVRAPITNCPGERGVVRKIVPGSVQVYPLSGYGAIQMGEHMFIEENSPTMTIAKFTHVWKNDGEEWKISRVLSYDHKSVARQD